MLELSLKCSINGTILDVLWFVDGKRGFGVNYLVLVSQSWECRSGNGLSDGLHHGESFRSIFGGAAWSCSNTCETCLFSIVGCLC